MAEKEAENAEKTATKTNDGEVSQPHSTSEIASPVAVDSASTPAETIVEQVKHAVGSVVEGITDRLQSVLHLKSETAMDEAKTTPPAEATTVRDAVASETVEVQVHQPEIEQTTVNEAKNESGGAASISRDLLEPDSNESAARSVASTNERSAAEEEILSNIEHVDDWAEETESEEEEEDDEEEEDEEEEDEEEGDAKSVDHDRDRRNPQFIPRSSAYFLHDDRLHTDEGESDDEEEKEEEEAESADGKKKSNVTTAANGDEKKVESGAGDADKKAKLKKSPLKKSTPPSDTPKRASRGEAAAAPAEPEKWGHDLYDETTQASKSQEEIKDRYGYNIRDDEQAPRGKRPRRYGRAAEMRGSGRGSRGFRGARRGVAAGGTNSVTEGGNVEAGGAEVVEKENRAAMAGEEVKETATPAREKVLPVRGGGARGRLAGRGGNQASGRSERRPLQQERGYDEEYYQPPRRRYDDVPSGRPRGGPVSRTPRHYNDEQQLQQQQSYDPSTQHQRSYPPRQPPQSRYSHDDDSYDTSHSGGGGGEFHSRVFFSRGRGGGGGARRGGGGGPQYRAPTFQSRPAPVLVPAGLSEQRPQPRLPLAPPPPRNPDVRATGIASGRPTAPPPAAAAAAPQSKRYSERRGQSIRGEGPAGTGTSQMQSDDVRASGGGGGGGRGGGGYGYAPSPTTNYDRGGDSYVGYVAHPPPHGNYGPPMHPPPPQQPYGDYYPASYYGQPAQSQQYSTAGQYYQHGGGGGYPQGNYH